MKLTDRQATLLARLAAAAERGGNNPWFLIVEAMGREPIALFTSNENIADVGEADLSELQAAGVVWMIGVNSKGKPKYAVTNEGFDFYRATRQRETESVPGERSKAEKDPRHLRQNPQTLREQRASPEPLRVFLCHSSGDKPVVRDVYERLTDDGFQPWLDEEDLLPGQDWDLEIQKAVRHAHVVVVFLSNASITKEGYVQKELKRALDIADEKPEGTIFVIPARVEDCAVPERLKKWHRVDLFDDKGYEKLTRALRQRGVQLGLLQESGSAQPKANDENSLKGSLPGPSALVGVRVGDKMHSHDEGFRIRVLMSNYSDRPIKLDRWEFEWWLSDTPEQMRTKTIELQQPLPVNAADQPFTIRLSDHEARSDRRDLPDLRALYSLLHGRARVYFNAQEGLLFAETPAFKIL